MLVNLNFDADTFRMHADKGDGIAQKIEKEWHSFELVLRNAEGAVVHRLKAAVDGVFDLLDASEEPEPVAKAAEEPTEPISAPEAHDGSEEHEDAAGEAPLVSEEHSEPPIERDPGVVPASDLSGFAKIDALAKTDPEHHE